MSDWPAIVVGGVLSLLGTCMAVSSTSTATEPDDLPSTELPVEGCRAVCMKHRECDFPSDGCLTECELSVPDAMRCGACWQLTDCTSLLTGSCLADCT